MAVLRTIWWMNWGKHGGTGDIMVRLLGDTWRYWGQYILEVLGYAWRYWGQYGGSTRGRVAVLESNMV